MLLCHLLLGTASPKGPPVTPQEVTNSTFFTLPAVPGTRSQSNIKLLQRMLLYYCMEQLNIYTRKRFQRRILMVSIPCLLQGVWATSEVCIYLMKNTAMSNSLKRFQNNTEKKPHSEIIQGIYSRNSSLVFWEPFLSFQCCTVKIAVLSPRILSEE